MIKKLLALLPVAALAFGSIALAQTSGEIEGNVADSQGLSMPGVTVTLSGEAVLGEQVAVALADGSYRFRALRRGSYNLRFELQENFKLSESRGPRGKGRGHPWKASRLLNFLAASQAQLGNNERAREVLLRSLEIEPDQPSVKELLDSLEAQEANPPR